MIASGERHKTFFQPGLKGNCKVLLCLAAWLWAFPLIALEKPTQPFDYDEYFLTTLSPRYHLSKLDDEETLRRKLKEIVGQGDHSAFDRYTILRQIAYLTRNTDEIRTIFAQLNIRDDDFLSLYLQKKNQLNIPIQEQLREMNRIFAQVIQYPQLKRTASTIAYDLSYFLMNYDEFFDAIEVLKKTINMFSNDEKSIDKLFLYDAMASAYEDPNHSRSSIEQGLRIHDEVEANYTSMGYPELAQLISFNKGYAKLRALQDYQGALDEWARISHSHYTRQESILFSSIALLGLGRRAEAREIYRTFDIKRYTDVNERQPHVSCIKSLLAYEFGETRSPGPACFNRKDKLISPLDILFLQRKILRRPPPKEFSGFLHEAFEDYVFNQLLPRHGKAMTAAVRQLDLIRAEHAAERAVIAAQKQVQENRIKTIMLLGMAAVILVLAAAYGLLQRKKKQLSRLNVFIRTSVLQRFLPAPLIEEILQGRTRLEEKPQKKFVTILFCDLVNFTQTSERLGSENTAELLHQYFEMVTKRIFECGGTIDKFMGDGIMVIFGAPQELEPHAQAFAALKCSRKILSTIQELNRTWNNRYDCEFSIRIGINSGDAIVGSFGSQLRSDYTVIGSVVNLASRIEHIASPNQIYVSPETAKLLPADELENVGKYALKGFEEIQEIYRARHAG